MGIAVDQNRTCNDGAHFLNANIGSHIDGQMPPGPGPGPGDDEYLRHVRPVGERFGQMGAASGPPLPDAAKLPLRVGTRIAWLAHKADRVLRFLGFVIEQ
jgi:hypothetical protein